VLDLVVGQRGQFAQDLPQVGVGIESAPTAVFDDGVEDGSALARVCIADEEPVLLFMESFP
jgi:hypothetical protein